MSIKNIKINDNTFYGEFYDINFSLINSLRRSIEDYIDSYVIDYENVNYEKNTSKLDNIFLNNRLKLYYIKYIDELDNCLITFDKTNEEEYPIDIYIKDFRITNNGQEIDTNLFFCYPDSLFTRLFPKESIKFDASVIKSNSSKNGAPFSVVTKCVRLNIEDEKKINELIKNMNESEKKHFLRYEKYKYFLHDPITTKPNASILEFESNGKFTANYLLFSGIKILLEKFNNLLKNIEIKELNEHNRYDYIIENEGTTIAEPLHSYLNENPEILFAGYNKFLPNDDFFRLSISTKNNNTKENNLNQVKNTIKIIIKNLNFLNDELNTAINAKKVTKIKISKKK